MALVHYRILFVTFITIFIYGYSWILQDNLFLNWDVGHLLNSAKLLLAGGSYTQDFFIPNTPTILHLYLPPILVSQFFQVDIVLIFRIYIYLIATISLVISYYFFNLQFKNKDKIFGDILFLVLVFSYLCLPTYEFGQRDHLLIMFAMPYLLAVAHQLQGHSSRLSYALIGLWAAIGFALKPQFLVTPLLIECYVIYFYRRLTAFIRPEVIAGFLFISLYSIITWFFYPDYISIVIPFLLKFYYSAVRSTWEDLLLNPLSLFFYLIIFFYFIETYYHRFKENIYQPFQTVLLISLISFIICYVTQRTTFYYHFIPAFTIALLLLTNLLSILIAKKNYYSLSFALLGLLAWSCFIFLIYPFNFVQLIFFFHPQGFCLFWAFIFLFLFYLMKPSWKVLIFVGITTLAITLYAQMAMMTVWQINPFWLTCLMLALGFIYLAQRVQVNLFKTSVLGLFASLLFAFPCLMIMTIYSNNLVFKKDVLGNLSQFLKTQPTVKSIYGFSLYGNQVSPLAYYAHVNLVQRFDCLWMIRYVAQQVELSGANKVKQDIRENKEAYFFIEMLAQDLHRHQPDLVLIDDQPFNVTFIDKKREFQAIHFNYLNYFNYNTEFKHEWKSYQYLTTIKNNNTFLYPLNILVYKRITRKA